MANVIVVGGGLGGLPTAYEIRHLLPKEHRVTLISEHEQFTFIPGLIRVALDLNPLEEMQLEIEPLLRERGIDWIHGRVTHIDPNQQTISVGGQTMDYDYIALATGASLAFDLLPGLGPDTGYTQSVCTPDHALHAREEWLKYLENPQNPLVVGAMPGAGCFGPAYEFALMADWEMRRRGVRDQVSITYITPEPYPGHLGVGGVKNAEKLTVNLMKKRGVQVIDNAEISAIDSETITLADGQQFPFGYSMILPKFRGSNFLQNVPGLTDETGFIPVTSTYRHPKYESVYALGVSVKLKQPDKTQVPIGLPKSGEMTEAMGIAVAHNIAHELGAFKKRCKPTLEALCFAEFGDTGIAYVAIPVVPDPATGKRRNAYAVQGRWVVWVKAAFERYFMLKMKMGWGVPWFEKLGLRMLFQVYLTEPLSPGTEQELLSA
ncbi:FAD/NAD(P)-binding oxidoreductase [Spirulina sp. CS-785/01]|uniref:NAD(P)/FAD-dependent oxidoreductase n=1 Tax=Spirulina sp. CS-785/01 TaxID=3021716 RepID=UPI00232C6ABD|nr:FAD/NAD(P)-binding oxidoreductase [Spirulina sp. CS-785/01]MDB9313167.1 FAD/NAD(P)-binding oxidoreductase [Spirulina sp. CS-785/01]